MTPPHHLIIAAGGIGKRLHHVTQGEKKQFVLLGDKTLVEYCLEKWFSYIPIHTCILVVPRDEDEKKYASCAQRYPQLRIVYGGAERQDSIAYALAHIPDNDDIVIVHDAVRPFFSQADCVQVIDKARECGAAVVGVRAKDTIRISDDGKQSSTTLDRAKVWLIQTPQAFRARILKHAYSEALKNKWYGTDDASLVEKYGNQSIALVEGTYRNFKITDPFDLEIAEYLLNVNL